MAIALMVLLVWVYRAGEVRSASLDICYLIDQTRDGQTSKRGTEDKLQLARDISRCILDRNNGAKIATIVYDNHSAKLGFNFKSVSDVLDDGFAQILHKHKDRRSSKNKDFSGSPRLRDVRYHNFDIQKPVRSKLSTEAHAANDSPQTMAFLTAAEVLVADEAENEFEDEDSLYKLLVISDSNAFPVIRDVTNFFANASVDIHAVDLSEKGSQELEQAVTSPSSEHYHHNPSPADREWIQDICAKLVKVPAKHRSFKSGKLSKLLRAEEVSESLVTKDAPRYQFPPKRLTSSQRFSDLDHFIESDSSEYKWSGPESELESRTADGNIGNLGSDDRTEICKSIRDDCAYYAKSGLCDDKPEMKGMKQLCKQTCKFCA